MPQSQIEPVPDGDLEPFDIAVEYCADCGTISVHITGTRTSFLLSLDAAGAETLIDGLEAALDAHLLAISKPQGHA